MGKEKRCKNFTRPAKQLIVRLQHTKCLEPYSVVPAGQILVCCQEAENQLTSNTMHARLRMDLKRLHALRSISLRRKRGGSDERYQGALQIVPLDMLSTVLSGSSLCPPGERIAVSCCSLLNNITYCKMT